MNNSRTNTIVSNKAIVKQLYHDIMQDNITAVLNMLADDVEWIFYGPSSIPMAGYYYGKIGVLQFFETANQVEQLELFEPHEYIEGDNQVVVVGFQKATSIETGKSFNCEWTHIWNLKNGKVTCLRIFTDTAAIAAAYAAADEDQNDSFL